MSISEIRLQNNSELVTYLNNAVTDYELVKRKIWYEMTDINFNNKYKSDADYEKHCRTIYGMHS